MVVGTSEGRRVNFHILCVSHLAWDAGLFQRPQQVMSRLNARGHAVLYAGLSLIHI